MSCCGRSHQPVSRPAQSTKCASWCARSLAAGAHRDPARPGMSPGEVEARAKEDVQDAELVRVAAYAGLRRGELVALRWRDVDFAGHKIIVRRSLSGDTELRS